MRGQMFYIFGQNGEKFSDEVKKRVETIYQNITTRTKRTYSKQIFSLYYLYPLLFSESFQIENDKLIDMCVLSVLCLNSCLYDDKILDSQEEITESGFYSHNLLNIEIGKLVQQLVGDCSIFWDYYDKYYEEYVGATMLERKKHFGKLENYSREEFLDIAKGKQAMCKIIPAMFCCLQNDFRLLNDYEKAMDISAAGMQIYDDLRDWKSDFSSQRVSWLLNVILHESGLNFQSNPELISNYLFDNNLDSYYLDMAKQLLDMSMVNSKRQLSPTWYRYIRFSQAYINKLRADLLKIRGLSINALDYLYVNKNTQNLKIEEDILRPSLEFINNQYKKGFADVKEWMLSAEKDKEHRVAILGGDIFMRSQIFNLLSETISINRTVIETILSKEKEYFLSSQSPIYKYGWVYVEGLYGNCPDLDTFSEILRAGYCKDVENIELKIVVEKILNKVLTEHTKPYFSTWIIDKGEPAYDFVMDNFTMMGDLEVTSNFIKSLYKIDFHKYSNRIVESLAWIEGKQNEQGFWDSTWYVGNYYCGYVLAPLGEVDSFSNCYQRFLDYLYCSQNENGSWGDGEGNPLDTAYAVYAIAEATDMTKDREKKAVERGVLYLLSTRNSEGYWFSCEFIKMGQGKKDISCQNLRYKSVTLTTTYCFAALAKVYKKIGEYVKDENK